MSKSFIKKYLAFIISGLIILTLVILYFLHPPFQEGAKETWAILMSEDEQRIHDYVKRFGIWGPIAIIVFTILQMFLIIFPSFLPIIIAVRAYGFWYGVLISLIGVGLSSTLGYYLSRRLKGLLLSQKKYEKMKFWMDDYGFGTVVLFRISPFFSNDGISFIAGFFKMSFRKFLLATYAGMIPLCFAVAYFSKDLDRLKVGLYWIGGVGAALYALYIYFDYKKRKKND